MNLIFLTQGSSFPMFHDVYQCLKTKGVADKAGFYTAQSDTFDQFNKMNRSVSELPIIKEWELLEKASKREPDLKKLRQYEELLGDPFLWNAIVCDRRIYCGKNASYQQDYTPRYSYNQMLTILQTAIENIEDLFDEIKPDAVVGFICVTIGDYLGHLVARKRNIPLINLRPTRIKNYFYGAETVEEPSQRLIDAYENTLSGGMLDNLRKDAESFVAESRSSHTIYEGVTPPSGQKNIQMSQRSGKDKLKNIRETVLYRLNKCRDYQTGKYRFDNYHMSLLRRLYLTRIKKPIRALAARSLANTGTLSTDNLQSMNYAFYPLHKEPEVQLLVYSRPFMNQIEVIRNLARSLPMGMKLLVKEHPSSIGYRPAGYYRKITSIPNVLLAPHETPSRLLVEHSELVAVISGSTGFEALLMKKPVIHLGNVIFGMLPDTMIKRTRDLDNLPHDINTLLRTHQHNENALLTYIAATIQMSVPVDFYSRLLRRKGVAGDSDALTDEASRNEHIERLANYIAKTAQREQST